MKTLPPPGHIRPIKQPNRKQEARSVESSPGEEQQSLHQIIAKGGDRETEVSVELSPLPQSKQPQLNLGGEGGEWCRLFLNGPTDGQNEAH